MEDKELLKTGPYILERAILDYLEILKAIQEYRADSEDTSTPYGLEMRRQELHKNLVSTYTALWLNDDLVDASEVYERSKIVLGHLDKVCEVYSLCEEWKLKDDADVKWMMRYLYKYLTSTEVKNYFERGLTPHSLIGLT